ncbi:monofunctional biosynthetic peptidoglycan transglycosylase [bacterium]|nr:monofunctional biosynthetic peptidoglycan transglycosylase [bacterium]
MALRFRIRGRWIWILLCGAACAAGLFLLLRLNVPDVGMLQKQNPGQTAMMRYRKKQASSQGKKFNLRHRWVPLSAISRYLARAVVIAEDDKFYQHEGFDWEEIWNAVDRNIRKKRFSRGASTITQQLAKNLYLSPEKSLLRKLREALIARDLDRKLRKRRILELYLNIVEWGDGIFGAEAAAQYYYNKPAAGLTPSEAIRMACTLPNPLRYSPPGDRSRFMKSYRSSIAERMLKRGFLTREEYDQLDFLSP